MSEYDSVELEIASIAERICRRPGMWTANGFLEEGPAMLSGFELAIQCASAEFSK